jgi:hypothetical protein
MLRLQTGKQPPPPCRTRTPEAVNPEVIVSIFTILFVILLVAWILGWGVFHVASGLIHILLIVAIISLILHFVRGSTSAV